MARVGHHCSHEQHAPGALLAHARAAERAGFAHAMCSDPLMPWSASDAQGHAGFAWTWLGAAMQATGLTFGATDAEAERTAENWKFAAIADTDFKADVAQPRCFDAAVAGITPADLRRAIRISASAEQHAVWIAADLACGVDRVYVHHVGASDAEQARFLERCAPALVRL